MSYLCDDIECNNFNLTGNITINGASGTNGQILATNGVTTAWTSMSSFANYMRFYNNTPLNVNTGTNVFAVNGIIQANIGSPFTFNVLTGTFPCAKSGVYTFRFKTMLSTHDAQSKFVFSNGTDILATCDTDYLPGVTTEQPFEFAATLPANFGEVWAVGFVSFGVGGIMNTSGADSIFPTCPTTTLEIIG